MSIIKSIPCEKIINGYRVKTSDYCVVSEPEYKTTGDYAIIITGVDAPANSTPNPVTEK